MADQPQLSAGSCDLTERARRHAARWGDHSPSTVAMLEAFGQRLMRDDAQSAGMREVLEKAERELTDLARPLCCVFNRSTKKYEFTDDHIAKALPGTFEVIQQIRAVIAAQPPAAPVEMDAMRAIARGEYRELPPLGDGRHNGSSAATEHADWAEENYQRARDCMIGILRGHAWTIRDGKMSEEFDNAFQHAVGILSLTARHLPAEPQGAPVTPAFEAMISNLVELDKQRTPGPWRKSHEAIGAPGNVNGNPGHLPLVAECDTDFGMYKTLGPLQAGRNARFIVALENAWPKILAALALPRPERQPPVDDEPKPA